MDARAHNTILSRCRVWLALGCALSFWVIPAAESGTPLTETIQVQTFPTHSRLVFRIDESIPVEWKETSDGFQAIFKGLGFTDLGAPLGEEDQWAAQFKESLKDPRLASIELREVAGGLLVEGKWKFAAGSLAPADPKMETFDYRDRTPDTLSNQFVVDFWVRKGPTVAEVQALRKKQVKVAKVQQEKQAIQQRVHRRIASEKAKAELSDMARFCSLPLSEERDVFLPFHPANDRVKYSKYLPQKDPDADFPYFEPKGSGSDAQYVRLALKLYRDKKYGLAIRTLDFLDTEHPDSPYQHEMRFLRANALMKLELKDEGEKVLSQLKNDAKGKPVALYAALYQAARQVDPVEYGSDRVFSDPLGAYETFSWLLTHYPDHRLAWLFHLGAADALGSIKQTERAVKEYEWVVENAKLPEQKAEAALRIGNLHLDRRQYEQALGAYANGIRYFKKEAENYPAIHINRGETLYWLGELAEARKVFEEYTDKFGGYPEGWRATFRLGEILGRSAKAEDQKASRRWFYETINRYPLSVGATLARLRLASCGDHGGFTFESAKRFFDSEAKDFDASGRVSMVAYPDMRALAQVRSYISLGREDQAVDVAQEELARVKSQQVKNELAWMYEGLFRKNILSLLDQGRPYEALDFYEKRARYRVKGVSAAEPDFLLRLSLAASELGLGKLGESLAAEYRKAGGGERSIASDSSKRGSAPSDLDLRIKVSEQSFAEARSLWISSDSSKESETGLKNAAKIREKLDQVAAESPFSFEKEIILGLMEEQNQKPQTARSHALKAQVLVPSSPAELAGEMKLQIGAWLASLEAKSGDPKLALGMYREIESSIRAAKPAAAGSLGTTIATDLGVPPVPLLEQILISQGQILEGMKRWGESAAVYSKAVGEGIGGNQAMYGYARALLKSGGKSGREKAIVMLEKLSESKTEDFWKKLAKDTLEGERLRDRHK